MTNRATGPISVNGVDTGSRMQTSVRREDYYKGMVCDWEESRHNDFCYNLYSKTTQNLRRKGRVLYIAP